MSRKAGEPVPSPGEGEFAARFSVDDLNIKVQQAQEVLLDLERRREEIERQKRQLEELRKKQRDFEVGHREVTEELTRSIALLERQEEDGQRELEDIRSVRKTLAGQLASLEALEPSAWEPANLADELAKALALVDQSRAALRQAQGRIDRLRLSSPEQEGAQGRAAEGVPEDLDEGFGFWRKVASGFAYSLPLILSLLGVALFWFLKK
ncbi:hypothetical protein MAMC_00327 [Methylacidimicrobium cyclopophantes]|uniref:Chromosome partition protein Smc n=1 Tax=Methylacidimicrobium cyclopophantes TaxID=1041766 RepID=A0A5E6MHI2_9BACT|nr:hypothetical protein [Methylacidimicrobium cyclopophantes]VVM04956.1 hypothetical protein MAMC_00327 [Methylacidimicrobium cyclopophantes]